jgi:polyisoprenoid-binding protein YceI
VRSNDFFDMPTYPEITFTSTAVEHGGGDSYRVTGDLSIKGTTKPVTLDVEFTGAAHDPMGNDRIGFEIGCTVNRKDWGITWNAPLEGRRRAGRRQGHPGHRRLGGQALRLTPTRSR